MMKCPNCRWTKTQQRADRTHLGYVRWRCQSCGHRFNERSGTVFNHLQYPTDIVLLVVLWRIRYKLSLRDLVEMFLMRGYEFSHETVRDWETRFAPLLSAKLKAERRGQAGRSWYVDETYVKVQGRWQYLYRAIDRDGNLVDTRLSDTRDLEAAKRFFEQALDTVGHKPERVTTDQHSAYPQSIPTVFGFGVLHRTQRYLNNRIEQDHRAIKQRYYPMRGFGSAAGASRFCTAFEEVRQFFRLHRSTQSIYLAQRRELFRERCVELFTTWKVA
jgi:putative transposase